MDDRHYMEMALALAEKGKGFTSPNPMVGAVVVKDDQIVGKGWHKACGGPHAEVNAIDDAGDLARGATIYVTLEPCNHTGKTPPCTLKIIDAGIKKVVMAMKDPNPVASGGTEFLRKHGIIVESGVLEQQARSLNEIFIKHVLTKRPFVILKYASTLDGRIATRTGDSKWITNEKSRAFVHELRHLVDGIMVGVDTVIQDDPSLTTRIEAFNGRDPRRFILDTRLRTPEESRILHLESDSDTFIVCGADISLDPILSEKKTHLEKAGIKIIEAPLKNDRIDLDALMVILGGMNVSSLLIEGGSRVLSSALQAGIVDKICGFYAPKILGGDDGVPLLRGPGPEFMKDAICFKNMSIRRFDDDIMIEAYASSEPRG
ncbi:MAG: bifunctional diaminohydroxyphosphoribosylaminopyrimidine deaminase/5-amino-6-(5-phosphoribosylamino)uracil reductase RibD [Desulfobacteraceae bacterium]|jgi:diaminohydroxyphosphoribosylaminopyrimidine deaminase/5-amino-6-(5-phosphoribosylamino)uracil reductase